AGLLGSLGETTGAQPIARRLHVAAGLFQRLLAAHHPHAGQFAELFNLLSGNSHLISPFRGPVPEPRPCSECVTRSEPDQLAADVSSASAALSAGSSGASTEAPRSAPRPAAERAIP